VPPAQGPADGARDLIWTLNALEVWNFLVTQRGWTPHPYGAWTARAMADGVPAGCGEAS
jgi:hypothetical protein